MTSPRLRALTTRVAGVGGRAVITRAALLASGWWVLSEGDPAGLVFGAMVALAALVVSVSLPSPPSPRWRPIAVVRFALLFVAGSVRGGVDVARRALAPRMPIAPSVVEYTLRLPEGAARNLLLGSLNLMPGTLSIVCEGQRLDVHVIAVSRTTVNEIATLEASIAAAMGMALESPRG